VSTEVKVPSLPDCDLKHDTAVKAHYDGKTIHGPWAFMCEAHFQSEGTGLGTGRGQKLIVAEEQP
jgi:hypothetical protein